MGALESWRYICDDARWIAIRPPVWTRSGATRRPRIAELFRYFAVSSAAFEENDPSAPFFARMAA